MATQESVAKMHARNRKEEEDLQLELRKYLDENPFPNGDYESQRIAYEHLVEVVLRLQKRMRSFSFSNFGRSVG